MHYRTGLIVDEHELIAPFPYRARGWTADVDEGPRYGGISKFGPGTKELIIVARKSEGAAKALTLIKAAVNLHQGAAFFHTAFDGDCRPTETHEADESRRDFSYLPGLATGCLMAAKATRHRRFVYALSKWNLSSELFSIHHIALDPHHTPTIPRSRTPGDHVRYAYAIVTAYSVIEELGLEVRASNVKPSSQNGQWNPLVRIDLEERLRQARISLSETFNWNVRGPQTQLEAKQPSQIHKTAAPAPWARWDVRDIDVDVIDAIAHASWLRSHVSSHRLNHDLVRLLSVYDVANVQYLGRRLLMETLGLWRVYPRTR